jgi:hypothetical protein
MFTKRFFAISMLAGLSAVGPACVGPSDTDMEDDEEVDTKEDGAGAANVLASLGGILSQVDGVNQSAKDNNALAVIGGLLGLASFIPEPSGYAEISPEQIEKIASETAKKTMAAIDKTNMKNYIANSKTDLKDARVQYSPPNCTPGKPIKNSAGQVTKPHCTDAQLSTAYETLDHYIIELGNDWSDMTSLRKKSPALAMMAAKSIVLVGAARMHLTHHKKIVKQMIDQTSKYNSSTSAQKNAFKVVFTVPTDYYRGDLKTEMDGLRNQFEPALDNIYTLKVVVKDSQYSDAEKRGCAYDQADKETCGSKVSYKDCDWELGCFWDKTPSDQDLLKDAESVRENLQNGIRSAKKTAWLGSDFNTQYNKL